MTSERSFSMPAAALLATGFLAGLAAYPNLPGEFLATRASARMLVAFTLPATALAVYAMYWSLWRHDRVRSGNGAFEATYQAIVLWAVFFVVALHVVVMARLTGAANALGVQVSWRLVVVLLGLVTIAIGNLLPRTRPNVAVGVRTTRTLGNAQVWQQVHRVAGYTAVGLGLVIVLASLVIAHKEAIGAVVSAAALCAAAVVFASYRWSART